MKPNPKYGWSQQIADDFAEQNTQVVEITLTEAAKTIINLAGVSKIDCPDPETTDEPRDWIMEKQDDGGVYLPWDRDLKKTSLTDGPTPSLWVQHALVALEESGARRAVAGTKPDWDTHTEAHTVYVNI